MVDLPGLGEVAVGAEAHHVDGLQNEVDVVLLVKRAMGDEAYWGEADARTLDLLDIARGFVAKRDFVFLVLNQGGIDPVLQRTLRDDVHREINMGEPDRFFQVLETDAADDADVFARVLGPVLRHLTERMPAMDAEVLAGTRAETLAAADRIELLAADLGRILGTVRASTGSAAEDLQTARQAAAPGPGGRAAGAGGPAARAGPRSQRGPGVRRRPWSGSTRPTANGSPAGSGVGEQRWRDEGLRRMRVDGFSAGYTGDELNRIRVEISGSFEQIDGVLRRAHGAAVERGRRGAAAAGDCGELLGRPPRRRRAARAGRPARPSVSPVPAAAPCRAGAARASGWTTAPSCTRGCAPSWTG